MSQCRFCGRDSCETVELEFTCRDLRIKLAQTEAERDAALARAKQAEQELADESASGYNEVLRRSTQLAQGLAEALTMFPVFEPGDVPEIWTFEGRLRAEQLARLRALLSAPPAEQGEERSHE